MSFSSYPFQHNFPKTLEAFVLHALTPVGTEVLTRKFEQLDQMVAADDQYIPIPLYGSFVLHEVQHTDLILNNFYVFRSLFYQKFYSVFDDTSSAMEALLNGKESFASQVLLFFYVLL